MSENRVTWLLFIILIISSVPSGTPLQCYVCTSVANPECTSSLSGIQRSTCSLDEDSPSTSIAEDSSTSSTAETWSTETSSSEHTSSETDTSYATSEETSPFTSTSWENDTTTESLTSTVNESSSLTSTTPSPENEEGDPSDPENNKLARRVVRETATVFACYTLTLIKNGETVTDRGCVPKSSSMCATLNQEKYPNHNLSTCTTCNENGCNSSAISLSEIPSVLLPLIMFLLVT